MTKGCLETSGLTSVFHELVQLLQKVLPLLWEGLHFLLRTGNNTVLRTFFWSPLGVCRWSALLWTALYLLFLPAGIFFLLFLFILVVILAARTFFLHFRLPGAGHHKLLLELQGCVQCCQNTHTVSYSAYKSCPIRAAYYYLLLLFRKLSSS